MLPPLLASEARLCFSLHLRSPSWLRGLLAACVNRFLDVPGMFLRRVPGHFIDSPPRRRFPWRHDNLPSLWITSHNCSAVSPGQALHPGCSQVLTSLSKWLHTGSSNETRFGGGERMRHLPQVQNVRGAQKLSHQYFEANLFKNQK